MKKINEEKLKRVFGLGTLVFIILSILLEVLRKNIPAMTLTPTSYEYLFSTLRNISSIFLALFFTVFIFLVFKKRFGLLCSVFITLMADSFIAFAFGALLMMVSTVMSTNALGITAIESIYTYLLGMMTAIVSAIAFIASLIIFLAVRLVLYIISKNKKA